MCINQNKGDKRMKKLALVLVCLFAMTAFAVEAPKAVEVKEAPKTTVVAPAKAEVKKAVVKKAVVKKAVVKKAEVVAPKAAEVKTVEKK